MVIKKINYFKIKWKNLKSPFFDNLNLAILYNIIDKSNSKTLFNILLLNINKKINKNGIFWKIKYFHDGSKKDNGSKERNKLIFHSIGDEKKIILNLPLLDFEEKNKKNKNLSKNNLILWWI